MSMDTETPFLPEQKRKEETKPTPLYIELIPPLELPAKEEPTKEETGIIIIEVF